MAELFLYEVPHRNYTTTVKLSEADAEQFYGDEAKKVRPAAPGVVPPAPTQPWAATMDETGTVVEDEEDDDVSEKKAPASRNKARSAANKG